MRQWKIIRDEYRKPAVRIWRDRAGWSRAVVVHGEMHEVFIDGGVGFVSTSSKRAIAGALDGVKEWIREDDAK